MSDIIMILDNPYQSDGRVIKEAEYLLSCGHNVTVLALDKRGDFADKPNVCLNGVNVIRYCVGNTQAVRDFQDKGGSKIKKLFVYLNQLRAFKKAVKKYLKSHNYDYLHCHDLTDLMVGASLKKNATLIFDMHEIYEMQNKARSKFRKVIHAIVDHYIKKADYVVYVNQKQLEIAGMKYKDKFVYLPNYADASIFSVDDYTSSDNLRLNYIGVVRHQVRMFKLLFDACKDLSGLEINVHGSGVDYTSLKAMEPDYPCVKIHGRYDGATETAKLYSQTDVLYIAYDEPPGYDFRFPIKFYEALASKTPVIVDKATRMGDFVIKHGIGYAIDINSVDEIKSTIMHILSNRDELNIKRAAIRKIAGEYDWNEAVKRLNEIYKQ